MYEMHCQKKSVKKTFYRHPLFFTWLGQKLSDHFSWCCDHCEPTVEVLYEPLFSRLTTVSVVNMIYLIHLILRTLCFYYTLVTYSVQRDWCDGVAIKESDEGNIGPVFILILFSH